ncbi:MAG: hypothetical protein QOG59_20, partial [Solirubrobacteraceae bacterium]|nr:hypothetical protein [Solirubrobacteraceae bacterium]
ALENPYPRLERTAAALNTVMFGTRAAADRVTARIRRVHSRVRGELSETVGPFPAGTPWNADDPELLLWIIATLVDSSLLVYERYVRPLTQTERQEYWSDYRTVARLFGLRLSQSPEAFEDLRVYLAQMLAGDDLQLSAEARALGIQIVLKPPVPLRARPLLELANFITVGLLPGRLRRDYGLRWDPLRGLVHRGGAQYARRVLVPILPGRVRYNRSPRLAA